MIILIIKSFFFSRADNYSLRQKSHTFYFLFSFCRKMIRVIWAILTIVTKDLEVRLYNLNLPLEKSVIWFESSAQKGKTGKQMASALYYQY